MPSKHSIIIIEDHPIMRNSLASYFGKTGRWQVTGVVSNLVEARKLFMSCGAKTDMVLIDIQLEDGWGLDIIPWYARQVNHALHTKPEKQANFPVMAVYSAYDDYPHVRAALGMGVRAYVCKRRSEQELEEMLLKALDGETCIDSTVQQKIDKNVNIINILTKREAEIMSMVKQDLSNTQIAARLGISRRTVENILSCVYDKTGIGSRLELQKL